MYEINKEAFAAFLAQQRREKGWTQKDLAQRLYVSDKAVSKWERGLSLPDISLLLPLADCLGVGRTELLEGKRAENPVEAENVEILVKKALSLAEEDPEQVKVRRKERAMLFAGAAILGVLESLAGSLLLGRGGYEVGFSPLAVYEVLGLIFGLYFWCFMKERLPGYYDENRIGFYTDGFLEINFPGVSFNNTNWPHIVKAFRIWSIVTILTVPLLNIVLTLLPIGEEGQLVCQMATLFVFLGSLFLPVYLAAGREKQEDQEPRKGRKWMLLIVLVVSAALLLAIPGMGSVRSSLRVGYVSSSTFQKCTARYLRLTGTERYTLRPRQEDYVITVVTEEGSLSLELRDETGVVFSQEDIQSGIYPVCLEGTTHITITAQGHKGSFAITPEE